MSVNEEYENFKERVRSTANIVEVISSYVTLKKRGHKYWGCCPFHGEKTPSFSVDPSKNMFYCFGCHEGGDIFKFIMKSENCGFVDALKLLAKRYGVPVPERQKTAAEIKREQKNKRIYDTNAMAVRFFQACLLKTDYGKEALAYLKGRGITEEIINSFSIGYALNNYTALTASLERRGFSKELLMEAGLALKGKGVYDKFRNRVMIPIKDPRGRVVGFGGRVLDDSTPKYLNTGETEWFNKRHLLFGFDIALDEIRRQKQAIVVEGYMDAISLHAVGITNVVASMGTAFAAEQAKLLQRAAEEVVFCYDSDAAGRRASVRAVSIAREAGLRVRVAAVPDGKDPDEYIRHYGKDGFIQVIKNAQNGIDFQMNETISQNNVTNLAGKVEAVSNILPFLLECKNEIEIAEHIRRLAQRLTIDEGLITEEFRKVARKGATKMERVPVQAPVQRSNSAEQQAEAMLLAVLLEQPGKALDCVDIVDNVGFSNPVYGQIFRLLLEQSHNTPADIDMLYDSLDADAASVLAGIVSRHNPEGDRAMIMNDCLRQMQRLYLEKEYEKHCQLAEQYEKTADARFMDELMESQRIKNEIKKLYR